MFVETFDEILAKTSFLLLLVHLLRLIHTKHAPDSRGTLLLEFFLKYLSILLCFVSISAIVEYFLLADPVRGLGSTFRRKIRSFRRFSRSCKSSFVLLSILLFTDVISNAISFHSMARSLNRYIGGIKHHILVFVAIGTEMRFLKT